MNNELNINEWFSEMLGNERGQFIENLKKVGRYNPAIIRLLNNAPNFEAFIIDSFIWAESFEGELFWRNTSKREYQN